MTTGRVFVDTNILIYSLDPSQPDHRATAAALIRQLRAQGRLTTSPQTLNECYRVLTDRRKLMPREEARAFVQACMPTCIAVSDMTTTLKAWEIQQDEGFAWWDCLMMASAIFAGCKAFLTEDAQSGRQIDGMVLIDPFKHNTAHLFERS
jgi:predicted nucleic acid-binding protein